MSVDQLVKNAESGSLVLHLDEGAITNIITACKSYIQDLRNLTRKAEALSTYPLGFSETKLPSGAKLAETFQHKAAGGENSAASTFESHIDQVEEMISLLAAVRSGYQSNEQNTANSFKGYGG